MELENKIVVDYKVKKKLLSIATYPTIRKALKGYVNTPQALRIRKAALDNGGVIIPKIDNDEKTNLLGV